MNSRNLNNQFELISQQKMEQMHMEQMYRDHTEHMNQMHSQYQPADNVMMMQNEYGVMHEQNGYYSLHIMPSPPTSNTTVYKPSSVSFHSPEQSQVANIHPNMSNSTSGFGSSPMYPHQSEDSLRSEMGLYLSGEENGDLDILQTNDSPNMSTSTSSFGSPPMDQHQNEASLKSEMGLYLSGEENGDLDILRTEPIISAQMCQNQPIFEQQCVQMNQVAVPQNNHFVPPKNVKFANCTMTAEPATRSLPIQFVPCLVELRQMQKELQFVKKRDIVRTPKFSADEKVFDVSQRFQFGLKKMAKVGTKELRRRIYGQEGFNVSAANRYLRRSKVKGAPKKLRIELADSGISFNLGQKMNVRNSRMTYLTEEESLRLTDDYQFMIDAFFPVSSLVQSRRVQMVTSPHSHGMESMLCGSLKMLSLIKRCLSKVQPETTFFEEAMSSNGPLNDIMNMFSRITHGMGEQNMHQTVDLFTKIATVFLHSLRQVPVVPVVEQQPIPSVPLREKKERPMAKAVRRRTTSPKEKMDHPMPAQYVPTVNCQPNYPSSYQPNYPPNYQSNYPPKYHPVPSQMGSYHPTQVSQSFPVGYQGYQNNHMYAYN